MAYTPPAGNAVYIEMESGYTPPTGDAVDFVMAGGGSLRLSVEQTFAMPERMSIERVFTVWDGFRKICEHRFSLPERLVMQQRFGDAYRVRKALLQVFGDMRQQRQQWHHNFGDAILIRKIYEQVFALPDLLRLVLQHDFAITSTALRKTTLQDWSIQDVDQLRRTIYQVYGLLGQPGEHLQYTVVTKVNDVVVDNPISVTIERDIEMYYIDCALTIAGQTNFRQYRHGAEVEISINGQPYVLMVTMPKRDRAHGGGNYQVDAYSPSITLGHGYAETVSGDLVGFASQIVAGLAPDFVIDWQIQDEFYGPGRLIVADEYPIEIITKLAAAMKGVVQSDPDGLTLHVIYRRPVRLDRLAESTPDYSLSDIDDFYTISEPPERRPGYNVYKVGNQQEAAVSLRMEEEQLSRTVKKIRGYQTPWDGMFDLTHTGGDWVSIDPLGIEERAETEVVEFVNGKGQVGYPIYSWSDIEWQRAILGTVTFSEDGSLESSVAGDSLLAITYQTKCKLWRVVDPRNEQLQLVSEEQDA